MFIETAKNSAFLLSFCDKCQIYAVAAPLPLKAFPTQVIHLIGAFAIDQTIHPGSALTSFHRPVVHLRAISPPHTPNAVKVAGIAAIPPTVRAVPNKPYLHAALSTTPGIHFSEYLSDQVHNAQAAVAAGTRPQEK